jgi:hypothetical protein
MLFDFCRIVDCHCLNLFSQILGQFITRHENIKKDEVLNKNKQTN